MIIPSVPAVLSRAEVAAWLEQIGVDAKDVPKGATLTLGPDCITISVFARDPGGNLFADAAGKNAAMHHISIPMENQ